jgi:GH15 family glucan-1,4-alpha-glucosidase
LDLYTASRRVSTAFMPDHQPLSASEYGAIGDGFSVAFVGVNGSVDWLCLPRFDSPSVFAALLDPERGGSFRISPVGGYDSRQAYDDATNVLQTLFEQQGRGVVVLTDFMPWTGDPRSSRHELHRLLEAREGSMELEIVFDPRFDYGRADTVLELADEGAVASADGEYLSLSLGRGVRLRRGDGRGVRARFTLRAGERMWVVMSWRSKRPEVVAAFRPFEHLRATRRSWRAWAARMDYDGPWRHDVLRSALMLKLLQYAPTGAMVAAPSMSLPVFPGGDRNWDYRYSWTRDSAMAIRTMNQIGYPEEAQGFFHFVRDSLEERDGLDIMMTIDGGDVPEETTLDHLAGHRGGQPVRLGNAARSQIQYDIVGPLLDAAALHEQSGGTLGLRVWRQIRKRVNEAILYASQPDHGIWEPRNEPAHNVHSKLMIWLALGRALSIAPRFGGDRFEKEWREARDRIRDDILKNGFDAEAGTFVGRYGRRDMDATLLLLPIYDFLPPRDPRIVATVDQVIEELGDGRFLRRYRGSDGLDSGEGGFILCGFWLAEALALCGRLDDALQVFHNHAEAANHLGLLSEEVDTRSGEGLGNTPQAFSHLGLIQAAARLDLALRLRDEGVSEPPRLAFDAPHVL